jgi:hypothetical protein
MSFRALLCAGLFVSCAVPAFADDQSQTGAGNAASAATAGASPLVQSALRRLQGEAEHHIKDSTIQTQTLDALFNPSTCILHRANLTLAQKQAIIATLIAQNLVNPNDGASIPTAAGTAAAGLMAGVFPAVNNDGTACPTLPMPWYAAPGSGNGSHHSYPGGLVIHEAANDANAINLADNYRLTYGTTNDRGLPVVGELGGDATSSETITITQDIVVGTPMWHDWAKPMVFQYTAAGTLFIELPIGGAGSTDNYGAAGDSRTGGHHILSLAEAMTRGLPAEFIIAQASAHSAPTLGNEFKVVNWLRAAAVIAQVDPVAKGYLYVASDGNLHLPPLGHLGDLNLVASGLPNLLVEYPIHNLSDADFVNSIPAVNMADVVLQNEAPYFGYYPATDASDYQIKFRNVAMSYLSAELIENTYGNKGLAGVTSLLSLLRAKHIL